MPTRRKSSSHLASSAASSNTNTTSTTTTRGQQQQNNKMPPVSSILYDTSTLISPLASSLNKSLGLINEISASQEKRLHQVDENLYAFTSDMIQKEAEMAKLQSREKMASCDELMQEVEGALHWVNYQSSQLQHWMKMDKKKTSEVKKLKKKRDKAWMVAKEFEKRKQWPLLRSEQGILYDEKRVRPHEDRYCYCNRVSFGGMIGCDQNNCERQWFHFPCVDINPHSVPGKSTIWYCPSCKAKLLDEQYRMMQLNAANPVAL